MKRLIFIVVSIILMISCNDVLHDEWQAIEVDAVEASRHFCQRILEDFYVERDTVEAILKEKKRLD